MTYENYCKKINALNDISIHGYKTYELPDGGYDEIFFEGFDEDGFNKVLKNPRQDVYCFVYGLHYDEYDDPEICDLLFHLSLEDDDQIFPDYHEQIREI